MSGSNLTPAEDVSGDTASHGLVPAKIAGIELEDEFADPDVDISHERLVVDHEVVPGHNTYTDNGVDFVVQTMGRMPPELDITCWVTQTQLPHIENIIHQSIVDVRTARYIGQAVPQNIDVEYSRTYHEVHGWIFEVSIQLLATQPENFSISDITE